MNTHTLPPKGPARQLSPEIRHGIRLRMLQIVISFTLMGVFMFALAGTLEWPMAWAFLGLMVANLLVNAFILLRHDPELVAERSKLIVVDKLDLWLGLGQTTLGQLGVAMAGGLWVRLHGVPPTDGVAWLGLAVGMAALSLSGYAMWHNHFFNGPTRIQTERGHTVQTGGPYRVVRHPGYVGFFWMPFGLALAFGGPWAMWLAAAAGVCSVWRTAREDRMLCQKLPGYAQYATQTRYRLFPGIW